MNGKQPEEPLQHRRAGSAWHEGGSRQQQAGCASGAEAVLAATPAREGSVLTQAAMPCPPPHVVVVEEHLRLPRLKQRLLDVLRRRDRKHAQLMRACRQTFD